MSETPSGAKRDLQRVGDLLDGVVAALGGRVDLGGRALLWADWSAVAGADWANSTPMRLKDGVLVVAVPDGMAATRLRYATAALIERIEARIGPDLVSSVRVQIERPQRSR